MFKKVNEESGEKFEIEENKQNFGLRKSITTTERKKLKQTKWYA